MGKAKDTKFQLGNPGRSKKWETPEQLQKEIDAYFTNCDNNPLLINEVAGKEPQIVPVPQQRPYTIEGLCLELDCDRKTLLNYQKEEGYEPYFHIVTRAKQKITEQYVTLGLAGGYKEGLVKFLLTNNTEYKDKQEIDITGNKIKVEIKD